MIIQIIFQLTLLPFVLNSVEDIQSNLIDIDQEDEKHGKEKYFKQDDWSSYHDSIQKAESEWKPCPEGVNCFLDQIKSDLKYFQDKGITKDDIERSKRYGVHYQIINNRLFRQADCMFPSRCEGVDHFLLKIKDNLPDMELIINVRDWPQIHNGFNLLPVFSFSRDDTANSDILYPAWSFWSGGPAIDQYPTGIGRFDLLRQKIAKSAKSWSKKLNKAFFRGSRTSSDRDWLVLLARRNSDLIDAQYTKNQAWRSPKDTLGAQPAPTIPFEDHCDYKYLINMRGVAASFRFKHLFLCKSLVLDVESNWIEFFYPRMKPWYHYVPVNQENFESILAFFKENDHLAKKIAKNGFNFIYNHLTLDTIETYWHQLLLNYSRALKYKPNREESLTEIKKKKS